MMTEQIPDSHKILFEKPIIANLGNLLPNGQIQVNPVWCDYDGTYVRTNSPHDTAKAQVMKPGANVTVLLVSPENAYFWIEVRGVVEEATQEGASEHIDKLAKKYLGVDKYPFHRPGVNRVMFKIKPVRVRASSPR